MSSKCSQNAILILCNIVLVENWKKKKITARWKDKKKTHTIRIECQPTKATMNGSVLVNCHLRSICRMYYMSRLLFSHVFESGNQGCRSILRSERMTESKWIEIAMRNGLFVIVVAGMSIRLQPTFGLTHDRFMHNELL